MQERGILHGSQMKIDSWACEGPRSAPMQMPLAATRGAPTNDATLPSATASESFTLNRPHIPSNEEFAHIMRLAGF